MNKAGKGPYDGVVDTDPDPNMTEDERFIFNRHGQLNKIKRMIKYSRRMFKYIWSCDSIFNVKAFSKNITHYTLHMELKVSLKVLTIKGLPFLLLHSSID